MKKILIPLKYVFIPTLCVYLIWSFALLSFVEPIYYIIEKEHSFIRLCLLALEVITYSIVYCSLNANKALSKDVCHNMCSRDLIKEFENKRGTNYISGELYENELVFKFKDNMCTY